jgi:RNA-directed DNA polymerase
MCVSIKGCDQVELPRRGEKISPARALRRVDELLSSGNHWVVDADLKSYFDTIPHERLMERVGEKIADSRVLSLIQGMLRAGVMDSVKGWQATSPVRSRGKVCPYPYPSVLGSHKASRA